MTVIANDTREHSPAGTRLVASATDPEHHALIRHEDVDRLARCPALDRWIEKVKASS